MALPETGLALDKLGVRYRGAPVVVDAERALAYAAATNDHNPAYSSGSVVPPVYGVVPAWAVLMDAITDLVSPEALARLLHGEHDMHFHQPLRPGSVLATVVEVHSLRPARTGTRLTLRVVSSTGDVEVLEQFATMFLRGVTAPEDVGPDKPPHEFPEEFRSAPAVEGVRHVDDDQTVRYAAASGDANPIHLDVAAARAVRLPGIVLHGLCTMAMCASAVVEGVAGSDPTRLRRLAVRFSWPVFPGNDLGVAVHEVGTGPAHAYAFEATSGGKVVVRDGRAEIVESR